MTTIGREKSKVWQLAWAGLTTGVLALGVAGCKSKTVAAPIVGPDGQDPAAANMAQPYTGGSAGGYNMASTATASAAAGANGGKVKVLSSQEAYQRQASGQDYAPGHAQGYAQNYGNPAEQANEQAYEQTYGQGNAAPIIRQAPAADPNAGQYASDQGYTDAEEAGEQALAETDQAPPPLPQYDQPPAPDPNYLWTPGYYNYASAGYYWVPGAWVAPPFYGALWTPPWWGFYGSHYLFHRGYWGSHVGFYGGINYGFGYIGTGYYGGYWRGHDFLYNRAVTNVDVGHIHNVYDRPVIFNNRTYGPRPIDRVDFNGGRGGIQTRPNPSEQAALHEAHYAPVAAQRDNRIAAASNRGQFMRADGGHPAMAFAAHPLGNAGNLASVPREQPFNHPAIAGRPEGGLAVHDARGGANNPALENHPTAPPAPGTGHAEAMSGTAVGRNFGGTANRGLGGAAGYPQAGHAPAGAPGQPGFEVRQGAPGNRARPGSSEGRNIQGGETDGQGRPAANGQRGANFDRPSGTAMPERRVNAGPQRPEGRFNAEPQRPAAPVQRPEGRFNAEPQRPAEPVQRPNVPAFRPETAPMQRSAPAAIPQRTMPTPHAAPGSTPHSGAGGGAGEHGGHP